MILLIFSMSVVFFRSIANATFNPMAIRAATIIEENENGKGGFSE
jgi:hypothetical protein